MEVEINIEDKSDKSDKKTSDNLVDIKIEIDADSEKGSTEEVTEQILKVIETSLGTEKATDIIEHGEEEALVNEANEVAHKASASSNCNEIPCDSIKQEDQEETSKVAGNYIQETLEDIVRVPDHPSRQECEDDIGESTESYDTSSNSLELEELTTDDSLNTENQEHRVENDKMTIASSTELKKMSINIPDPGSAEASSRDYIQDIQSAFSHILSPTTLSTLTPTRCGLCREDLVSEDLSWQHYTGQSHEKEVMKVDQKGKEDVKMNSGAEEDCKSDSRIKEVRKVSSSAKENLHHRPSYCDMVMEVMFSSHPEKLTERQIFEKMKQLQGPALGRDDKRTLALMRTRGLEKLIMKEFVLREPGDSFSATQSLLDRMKKGKQLREKNKGVNCSDEKGDNKDGKKVAKVDLKLFREQIIDFSTPDLPPSVVNTMTPDRCGLCKLEIYCKPWSHYTGPGHRTMVDIYKEGGYLGHPPYHTMIERYMKEVQSDNLKQEEVVEFVKKNFNVGDDLEKINKRVEKSLSMINKKKEMKNPKKQQSGDSLIWFKKEEDSSCEKPVQQKVSTRKNKTSVRQNIEPKRNGAPFVKSEDGRDSLGEERVPPKEESFSRKGEDFFEEANRSRLNEKDYIDGRFPKLKIKAKTTREVESRRSSGTTERYSDYKSDGRVRDDRQGREGRGRFEDRSHKDSVAEPRQSGGVVKHKLTEGYSRKKSENKIDNRDPGYYFRERDGRKGEGNVKNKVHERYEGKRDLREDQAMGSRSGRGGVLTKEETVERDQRSRERYLRDTEGRKGKVEHRNNEERVRESRNEDGRMREFRGREHERSSMKERDWRERDAAPSLKERSARDVDLRERKREKRKPSPSSQKLRSKYFKSESDGRTGRKNGDSTHRRQASHNLQDRRQGSSEGRFSRSSKEGDKRPGSRSSLPSPVNSGASPPVIIQQPQLQVQSLIPALQPSLFTQHPQSALPASFLTQHPQFPQVFILNTLGGPQTTGSGLSLAQN